MHFPLILSALTVLSGLALSTSTPSCPSGPIIQDGGFESGRSPPPYAGTTWGVTRFLGSSTYSLTSPGSTNNGGNYAFTAILRPGPYSGGISGETLSQTMNVCPGRNYSITVDYKFESAADNNCAVMVRYPYKDTKGSVTTPSGVAGGEAGSWYTTAAFFQAVSRADLFEIVFSCSNGASNRISVDNVNIAQFNGNAF